MPVAQVPYVKSIAVPVAANSGVGATFLAPDMQYYRGLTVQTVGFTPATVMKLQISLDGNNFATVATATVSSDTPLMQISIDGICKAVRLLIVGGSVLAGTFLVGGAATPYNFKRYM